MKVGMRKEKKYRICSKNFRPAGNIAFHNPYTLP
jgi:hypothetical protein